MLGFKLTTPQKSHFREIGKVEIFTGNIYLLLFPFKVSRVDCSIFINR